MLLKASTELPVKSRQGVHDARAGDAQTEMGANVGEMDGDMGVRSSKYLIQLPCTFFITCSILLFLKTTNSIPISYLVSQKIPSN